MNWPQICAAVIPCLNEAASIGGLIEQVRRYLPKVIVVDDGSSDVTQERAAAAGAEVIRSATSTGKGAALKRGWTRAAELGFEWVLCLDGDGQHAAADIPRFFKRAEETGAPLIAGNRMSQARGMPRLRYFVNRWMSRRLSQMAGVALPDTQCGFRLMHLETGLSLLFRAEHFEIESEQLLRFLEAGHRVEFVPIQVIYGGEESKIRPGTDTWRWFWWLAAERRAGRLSGTGTASNGD